MKTRVASTDLLKRVVGIFLFLLTTGVVFANPVCFICGKTIVADTVYTHTDAVTGQKVMYCPDCAETPDCYVCGVPSGAKGITLPDGRHMCPRDAKTSVLEPKEIIKVSNQMKDEADRDFVRFMSFPDNIQIITIDRLDVQSMYKLDGHDFESPDILGWCQAVTNNLKKEYHIGLMSGLPLAELQSTCIHELSHTWVGQNVLPERRRELMRSTEEGFCEMMAFLVMKKHGEERQQKVILKNLYTRGQVHLFIEAERRYGLTDILDWMKFGEATNLTPDHLDEIRRLKQASPAPKPILASTIAAFVATNSTPAIVQAQPTTRANSSIRLGGIFWSQKPVAIINGKSFQVNQSGNIPLGATKIPVRCLAITKDSVCILRTDSNEEIKLLLVD